MPNQLKVANKSLFCRLTLLSLIILIAAFSCTKGDESDPLQDGLVAYYPFNNNANDESGNGYHLSVQGAIPTSNRFNEASKAYSFNGIDAFMKVPRLSKADSIRNFTISVWIKADVVKSNTVYTLFPAARPFLCANAARLVRHPTFVETWYGIVTDLTPNSCSNVSIRDQIPDPQGKWTHLVFVQREIGTPALRQHEYVSYVNGQKMKTNGSGSVNQEIATSFNFGGFIGCDNQTGDPMWNHDYFAGSIDDIRIYNRSLPYEEVLKLYNLTK